MRGSMPVESSAIPAGVVAEKMKGALEGRTCSHGRINKVGDFVLSIACTSTCERATKKRPLSAALNRMC